MISKKTKVCILGGEITWECINTAINDIYNSVLSDKNKYTTLLIFIHSPGGDTDAAWSLYTTLRNIPLKVITVANGRVYSAATIVFLAGDSRLSYKESVFLFHPATIVTNHNEEKPLYQYQEELSAEKYDKGKFKDILQKLNPPVPKSIITKLTHDHKSIFIDAKLAKEYNIVTGIINQVTEIEETS